MEPTPDPAPGPGPHGGPAAPHPGPARSGRDPIPDAVETVGGSVVGIVAPRRGLAAGIVWRTGAVVTTASAVGRADRVGIVGAAGAMVDARVRGIDPATDLALIETDTTDQPAPRRRGVPRVGEQVFAVGREASGVLHASFGRIGAAGPGWRTWRGGAVDALVRLDGGLYPGLAGAPVADAAGEAIGVASPALSRHHGVALPWPTIDRVAEQLLARGRVARPYLGIAAQPVERPGGTALLVAGIADDGPAARGGLLIGDIIVAADGRPVGAVDALRDVLLAQGAGARVRLSLSRGGQPLELGIEVGERAAHGWCH